ncbi:MAG: hypothetical protein H7124_12095 [Phycisphaerales bacterium]|nr:hypothetical protein [Hyphomonadaceae bacterium]
MRAIIIAGAALLACACTQQADQDDGVVDMGPMPVVAGFYDSGPIASEAETLSVWFSDEMATAIAANAAEAEAERLDFDFRSWANDSEVENIRYAVGQHATQSRAEITTRFSQQGMPGGMHLTWNMCRLADGQWRIDDIEAIDVQDEPTPGAGEAITLRALLGLEAGGEGGCA